MSLNASITRLSTSPWSVFSTVPVGLGALLRTPLGPDFASNPPTRLGSYIIDTALPARTVLPHPANSTTTHATPIAAITCRRLRPGGTANLTSVLVHAACLFPSLRSPLGLFPSLRSPHRSRSPVGTRIGETSADSRCSPIKARRRG